MRDLRAEVEGLEVACHCHSGLYCDEDAFGRCHLISRADVLALIPDGAVLVTEVGLVGALHKQFPSRWNNTTEHAIAAALLRHVEVPT